ncbi:hypothetical protein [Chondromyces apiculatus]|uniref:Uncharacterized protein n=1 Tax=Chondromyces apiculatus DSM 436 TaxID=1192034 RepID=A0A017TID5_9BACT|nr:hypothetical protein [Chondromyces apiculatus]EYF08590.1 Hypothetical protein CAP_4120 [Chondromyces apiculatus DSM 436]
MNHIADWDPDFRNHEEVHGLGGPLAGNDDGIAQTVLARLAIRDIPQEVYRSAAS